jgi:two-component system, chemotaxis family, chemotaxis protein CheY
MKTLIVDDQADIRALMQGLLCQFGHCDQAPSGEAALELFQAALDAKAPYDVVFLDIVMPVLDGHETLKTMRILEKTHPEASGKTARYVILTLLNDDYNKLRAEVVSGADKYLTKPIDGRSLFDALREMRLID